MFRRKSSSLPKDPVFPTDLEGLGYVPFSFKKPLSMSNHTLHPYSPTSPTKENRQKTKRVPLFKLTYPPPQLLHHRKRPYPQYCEPRAGIQLLHL